jgi:hypothetical protein
MLDEGIVVNSYSLHLTEKSRVQFIHKNLKKIEVTGPVGLKTHYSIEVEDDVYDQVVESQIKHGLMIDDDPPKNPRLERTHATTITDYLAARPKPHWGFPHLKNVTVQFGYDVKVPTFDMSEDVDDELDEDDYI